MPAEKFAYLGAVISLSHSVCLSIIYIIFQKKSLTLYFKMG